MDKEREECVLITSKEGTDEESTLKEDVSCFWVGCNTLKKSECITYPIGCMGGKFRRIQKWINTNNLLE